jgi:hypothetical protein
MRKWLQRLGITTTPLSPSDKFEKVCGNVQILENGLVAENGMGGHAEVRGFTKYSTGTHTISLKIEKMTNNHWMFWGIISQNTAAQTNSYSSTSANKWAKNPRQVYLNGAHHDGYNNYQADIIENDTLHLILNCDNRTIELENERTK